MAIFVVLATVAGIVIVAITTSGNEDLEASGSTDLGENCRPNEVRDPALESMGISGTHEHLDQYKSETIGCKPYCGTWEYLTKGQNANGQYEYDPDAALGATIGGPDGAGGVYSSNIGCFAPCYWDYTNTTTFSSFGPSHPPRALEGGSRLRYIDNNNPPAAQQVRLGVNYRRSPGDPPAAIPGGTTQNEGGGSVVAALNVPNVWLNSDLRPANSSIDNTYDQPNADGKPYINIGRGNSTVGNRVAVGTELTPTQIAAGVPTVFIPNWASIHKPDASNWRNYPDPGGVARNNQRSGRYHWIDENWEYRADPINKVCTIVNVTQDDAIVCSSDWDQCIP